MRKRLFAAIVAAGLLSIPLASIAYPATTGTTAISFNGDQQLVNPEQPDVLGVQDLEPGIKTDSVGDIYVNGIRGVPAGADLWKTTTPDCQDASDHECPFFYMGQPDSLGPPGTSVAPGGGDVDMAIGAPYALDDCAGGAPTCPGSSTGNLYTASLTAANVTTRTCLDGNISESSCYSPVVAGTAQGDEDRPWLAAEGKHTAYLSFHNVGPDNITVCKSVDDGLHYSTCTQAITADNFPAGLVDNELGNIVVDNNTSITSGGTCSTSSPCHPIYQIFVSVATGAENAAACPFHTVYMAVSMDDGTTWNDYMVYNAPVDVTSTTTCTWPGGATGPGINDIFPAVAVDSVGNVYAEWTQPTFSGTTYKGMNVFFSSSTDHGVTWNGQSGACTETASVCTGYPAGAGTGVPTQVSLPFGAANCDASGPTTTCGLTTALFPWVAATGDGHVDFVWYGSSTNLYQSSSSGFGCDNSSTDIECPIGVHPPAWSVFFAQTFDGTAIPTTPTTGGPSIVQTIANHAPNHIGVICTGGTSCSSGPPDPRSLGDFFQVAIEPTTSCAVIAYDNDRDTSLPTQAYFNRQLSNCTANPTIAGGPGHIRAFQVHGGIRYRWTAQRAQTLGFNILAPSRHGKPRKLNPQLILGPRLTSDIMAVFRYYARHAHQRWFYLQQVTRGGIKMVYGPYEVGKRYL